jgi:hypothetical protein
MAQTGLSRAGRQAADCGGEPSGHRRHGNRRAGGWDDRLSGDRSAMDRWRPRRWIRRVVRSGSLLWRPPRGLRHRKHGSSHSAPSSALNERALYRSAIELSTAMDGKPRKRASGARSAATRGTPQRAFPTSASYALATNSLIVLTSDLTALTLLLNAACSSGSSLSSITFSTPPAPRMTGTPT